MFHRKSQQREKILELLKKTDTHPTAEWIYMQLKDEMPNLSLGTVYRNLNVLMEQKFIQKLPFGNTGDRFEAKIAPHYHLVCEQCGQVSDFEMALYHEINQRVQKNINFKVTGHRIDIFGICEQCQTSNSVHHSEDDNKRQ